MNKEETLQVLRDQNIPFEISEHKAVHTMEELRHISLPWPEDEAKNLFLRDDRKRSYYLVSTRGENRVDLRSLRKTLESRPLSFASEQDLKKLLGLAPGEVTPLGLLNDRDHRVIFCLDESFLNGSGMIGVHPNTNTATVWLAVADLLRLIKNNGNEVRISAI